MLEDVFHEYSILSCIPIDCSLTKISSYWPGLGSLDVMSILFSTLLFYTVIEHSVMVSARGCPGNTCISPVWLERCKLSLSLPLSVDNIYNVSHQRDNIPPSHQPGWLDRCNLSICLSVYSPKILPQKNTNKCQSLQSSRQANC